jgi:hypothetical protein
MTPRLSKWCHRLATADEPLVRRCQSTDALELGVSFGYSQGAGDVARAESTVHDLSGAGAALGIHAGYRLSPQFMIGVYGNGAQYSRGDALAEGTTVRSAAAGAEVNYHFRPSYTIDPWVGLGVGWHGLWLTPNAGQNTSIHGLELARVTVGADYRITPEVSIAPVLGADVSAVPSRRVLDSARLRPVGGSVGSRGQSQTTGTSKRGMARVVRLVSTESPLL